MRKTVFFLLCWWPGLLLAQPAVDGPPDYGRADSIAGLFSGHSLDHPALLADRLTRNLCSDREKFRALYTWVCTNITNNYSLFTRHKRKLVRWKDQPEKLEAWNRKFAPKVFHTLRTKRSTLCTGYAYLLRELSRHAGLAAEVVDGYGRTASSNIGGDGLINHSWNAVKLDGRWYLSDPTWSSGYIRDGRFIAEYNDIYFLADPALFVLSHYPKDTRWILMENAPQLRDFLNAPVSGKFSYAYRVTPLFPTTHKVEIEQDTALVIHFRSPEGQSPALRCKQHGEIRAVRSQRNGDGYVIYAQINRSGMHSIEVLMEGKPVLAYQLQVRR